MGEQGRGKMLAWDWGELTRERRGKKGVVEKIWGEEEEREWGAGQLGATRHPISDMPCILHVTFW